MCEYFKIVQTRKVKTRFNWYRDSNDWKPFHHDCAAYSLKMSRHQNVTVGISFGDTRELAFLNKAKTRIYVPQRNGMLFHFGRDVNINWQHAVNAVPKKELTGKGRISIIVWGWVRNCIEEPNSPQICNDPFKQGADSFDKEEVKVMSTELALAALKQSVTSGQYLSKRHRKVLAQLTAMSAGISKGEKKCYTCEAADHHTHECKAALEDKTTRASTAGKQDTCQVEATETTTITKEVKVVKTYRQLM